jgi:hypothetical protein
MRHVEERRAESRALAAQATNPVDRTVYDPTRDDSGDRHG